MPTPDDTPVRRYCQYCAADLNAPGAAYEYRDGRRRCAPCRRAYVAKWRAESKPKTKNITLQVLDLVAEQAQAEARHYKAEAIRLQTKIDALRGEQR